MHWDYNTGKMAIKKQFLKSKPICKVTFSLDAPEAGKVAVVGDFNGWDPKAGALKKLKGGTFKGNFNLPTGNSYEFRYLVDGSFTNDGQADRLQWNDNGGTENGVLDL